jgi:hypothetical protein
VVSMGKLRDYKDSFLEVLWIARSTVSTFWYWFPIIYMAYVLLQLWLMVFVSPLTLAILPVVLIIYGIRLENKRIEARYGLKKTKRLSGAHGLGAGPEPVGEFEWKIDSALDEYEKLLRKKNKDAETEKGRDSAQ